MLDVLSNGRLEVGVGKGITPFEHLQFGHSPEEAPARTTDTLEMLLKGWETGVISSEGSPFYDFVELELPFRPIQHPYPPLWSAGNVETAGRGGHNFIFPGPIPAEVRARYDELRAASRKEPKHQNPHVDAPWIAQNQSVVIAPTDDQAVAIARRAWSRYMEKFIKSHGLVPPHLLGGEPPDMGNSNAKGFVAADPLVSGHLVAGSPATVRDYYVKQARRGLANYMMLMTPFGDMTNDETIYMLDAFIEEVIPAVREVETAAANVGA